MSDFNGSDYVPLRDDKRLNKQLDDVRNFMLPRQLEGATLQEIADATGHPPASISAQLRHLRKPKHGKYQVVKKYLGGGLYRYWVQMYD